MNASHFVNLSSFSISLVNRRMKILIKNIGVLVQTEEASGEGSGKGSGEGSRQKVCGARMSVLPCLKDAWIALDSGLIADYGPMDSFPGISDWSNLKVIDATGKCVFPSWCDSHTHLVYAGSRENEYSDRLKGLSYQEIAIRGGGILNSAALLRKTPEKELYDSAMLRIKEVLLQGTGAIEIKSGYGLDLESELKMLRVIKKIKDTSPLTVKSTFLGAHAVPSEFKGNTAGYLNYLIAEMLPAIASEGLADYCDVFCEKNYFSKEETLKVLEAGLKHGLRPKVHAEQLSHSGGIEAGVCCNAISVDHLEFASDSDIEFLRNSSTMPTILPGAQLFLQLPSAPVRKMIAAGLPLAIASDFNPGSCPSGNMNLMLGLGCMLYKMTPEEVIHAGTLNSAYAMDLSSSHGSIAIGKKANLFITREIPGYSFLPYSFGSNLVETVILNGEIQ